ncbi:KilA-N domain-containing protein [Pseudomonas sp. PDM23]|uniref:KilA-N domain-containing protein n=1 Tax=unclassified Pseudomonas TaxID=196821 RepID=UPI00177F46D1|nr:KilA-N domain-containing protein [Pseudomonas sp. PDM23]MBD9669311.1 KilA-N domain-containing protein [Pseudomonas sp. PDM21]
MIARTIPAKFEGQAVSFGVNSGFRPELNNCTDVVITERKSTNTGSGKWTRSKLAIAFARWLTPDFAVRCDVQMDALALTSRQGYGLPVTVNPVTGFGDSEMKLAHKRPKTIAGAFFVPAMSLYGGGCAWETLGSAGFQFPRFANLRTVATSYRLATVRGSSYNEIGATPMHTRNPLAHAAALRAIALAALRADSSLSVRLARYNAAMAKVRALEAQGVDHAAS